MRSPKRLEIYEYVATGKIKVPFACAFGLQLRDKYGDGHIRGVLLGLDLGDLSLPVHIILMQAQQKLVRLVDLRLQFFLILAQRVLLAVDFLSVSLIFGLQFLGILAGFDIIILKRLITLHDFAHIIHGGEHLAQVVGLENQRQVIERAVFLHGPHPFPIALKLLFFQLLRVENLSLLIGDHFVIESDFLFVELNLLHGIHVAFIQGAFLNQNADGVLFQRVDLGLLCLALLLNFIALGAESFDFGLRDLSQRAGRQQRRNQHCA